jgi:hypothetical protein
MDTAIHKFIILLRHGGTSRSTSRRHHFRPGIQTVTKVTKVMAYVANAVTLWRWLQQCVPAALRAQTDVINLESNTVTVWLQLRIFRIYLYML